MPSFQLQYLFGPPSAFGLPDGDKVVLPAGPQTIHGPSVHMKSGIVSSHGTLPRYRDESKALAGIFTTGLNTLAMNDNFGIVTVEAKTAQHAYEIAQPIVERLCQALSLEAGQRFSATLQFIEDRDQNISVAQPPKIIGLGTTTTYNISQLHDRFKKSFKSAGVLDEKIDKAMLYIDHAFLLN